jgi:hypothetical protein
MPKEFAYNLDNTNLDGMMPEDLAEFARHATTLRDYAVTKHRAMILRAEGKTTFATRLEEHCDALYALLPSNWQW